jgi:hypothetical protein
LHIKTPTPAHLPPSSLLPHGAMDEWMDEWIKGRGGGGEPAIQPLMNELVLINSGRTFTLNWDWRWELCLKWMSHTHTHTPKQRNPMTSPFFPSQ